MAVRLQLCNLLGTISPCSPLGFLGDKRKSCMMKGHEVTLYPVRFVKREEENPVQSVEKKMGHQGRGFLCVLLFILMMIP